MSRKLQEVSVPDRVFFVQTEPNSGPNFGLTQPNFGLTQPNFGLTQSNFPPNSKFRAKMVKIVALTRQNRSNFGPNSAPKMV